MNDYWHIPRASLASSSSASTASSSHRSNKSNTNPPTVAHSSLQAPTRQRKERELVGGKTTTTTMTRANLVTHGGSRQTRAGQAKLVSNARRNSELSSTSAATTAAAAAAVLAAASASATAAAVAAAKRGSRSSQGSSGSSNNSTRSAASGSLLLTAANLERFAEIHKKQHQKPQTQQNKLYMEHAHNGGSSTTYATNLTQVLQKQQQQEQQQQSKSNNGTTTKNEAVITIDPNLDFIKTKDLDTVSIASSMHFTMVNGEGGPPKKPKRGLCDRGRQVTVLIVSMSTIFLLLIMGMVYALEMRARDMPQS